MNNENDFVANGFMQTLTWLNRGSIVAELSEAQDRLVQAVKETGKKGKITFTLEIEPVGKDAADDQVTVKGKVSEQLPKPNKSPNVFFIHKNSKLSRSPVSQLELFRSVDGGAQESDDNATQSTVIVNQ